MEYFKAEAAQKLMNKYGSTKTPFLFITSFDASQTIILTEKEWLTGNVYFKFPQKSYLPNQKLPLVSKVTLKKTPVPFSVFEKSFERVKDHLNFGNTYLINLTMPTTIHTNLSTYQIFQLAQAKYKFWLKDQFVVFSPETFIKIEKSKIYSFPMKGTIDASIKNAEEEILKNEKETAEHYTIVDLIRNDLSMISKNVKVSRFRYIDEVKTHDKTLLQVSSEIVGDLNPDFQQHLGDLLFKLLPAGSISGAPKKKTVDIIKEAEIYERGFYTGVMGFFDGENLDTAVMIRFVEETKDGLVFKSGGGITSSSNCQNEYQEMIDKVYLPIYSL